MQRVLGHRIDDERTHGLCTRSRVGRTQPSFRSTFPPATAPLTALSVGLLSVGLICQVESGRGRAAFVFVFVVVLLLVVLRLVPT
jgi:hypothetical protein